jgi:hypothetical protein
MWLLKRKVPHLHFTQTANRFLLLDSICNMARNQQTIRAWLLRTIKLSAVVVLVKLVAPCLTECRPQATLWSMNPVAGFLRTFTQAVP